MDYCDMEWFALEMKREHSIIFEIAPKCCISDSFLDYETYSIPSNVFLSIAIEIMVKSESESCSVVTLCDLMGYPTHGILQAKILEWVVFPFSRGSSQPRD